MTGFQNGKPHESDNAVSTKIMHGVCRGWSLRKGEGTVVAERHGQTV